MNITTIYNRFNELDEQDLSSFEEMFRLRFTTPFDHTTHLPAYDSIFEYANTQFKMSPTVTLMTMLPAMSVALGMKSYMRHGVHSTKPNVYVINVQESGKGKTQFTKWLYKNSIYKKDMQFSIEYAEEKNRIQLAEPGSEGVDFKSVNDKQAAINKLHRGKKMPVLTGVTPASLLQAVGQCATMLNYDELTTFKSVFYPNDPGKLGDTMNHLTQLYSEHTYKKSLVSADSTDVLDSSLSFYAHGTASGALSLFNPFYMGNGTTWRFWFTLTEKDEVEIYNSGGIALRRDRMKDNNPQHPTEFITAFDTVFDSMFDNMNECHFYYDRSAAIKREDVEAILRTMEAVYSQDEKYSFKKTMINKLFACMEKMSLLFHVLNNHELFRGRKHMQPGTSFSGLLDPFSVGSESVEAAFEVVRIIYSNWLDMFALKDDKIDTAIIADINKTTTKTKKAPKRYKEIYDKLGGSGKYSMNDIKSAIESILKDVPKDNQKVYRGRYMQDLKKSLDLGLANRETYDDGREVLIIKTL